MNERMIGRMNELTAWIDICMHNEQ